MSSSNPSWADPSNDNDNPTAVHVDEEANNNTSTWTKAATIEGHSGDETPTKGRWIRYTTFGISVVFLALFIASAVWQTNDSDAAQWLLFYIFQAVLVALFVLNRCCLYKMDILNKILIVLALGMMIWSIVLIGISAKRLADAESGGPDEGGDSDNATDKEEKAYEVAGASIGFASVIYHVVLSKCTQSDKDA